jgi:D-xylose 1-dehydrogenase (NADP+, D-xylono-1,5-lactone-forming)
MGNKLRWGILGTGLINEKILPHLSTSTRNSVVAVASRSLEKAKTYSAAWKIPKYHGEYAGLLSDPEVDAVYISLPNHLHFKWAESALLAGKHVLCEKPLTLKKQEAEILFSLAHKNGLKIAEGYMYRHHAQSRKILDLVRTGALGEIRRIQGSFHITVAPGPNIRTNAETGGGSIFDVGCYLVHLSNAIIGKAPLDLSVKGRYSESLPAGKVDTFFSALLHYGSGVTAHLDGGFLGPRIDEMRVLGSTGWLEIPHPFKPGKIEELRLYRRPTRDAKTEIEIIKISDDSDAYATEFENFALAVKENGNFPIADWESIACVGTLEKLVSSIET